MSLRRALFLVAVVAVASSVAPVRADENGNAEVVPDQSVCTQDVMNEATGLNSACSMAMFKRSGYQSCCAGLRKYYGVNSTEPSKNCFCVKDYYTYLTKSLSSLQFQKAITYCNNNAESSDEEIYYYIKAGGPCVGDAWPVASATTDDENDTTEPLPDRSLRRWISELHNDTWGAIMFTVGIISFIGFSLICWPFILALVLEAVNLVRKLSSRKVD